MEGIVKIRNSKDRNPKQTASNIKISNFVLPLASSIWLLVLAFLLVGCSGVKQSWTNFRAHYNSYHNAEKSFKSGIQRVNDQPVEVNPEQPARVHAEPPRVGGEDFDNTIEKGAQILRKFPTSKWTDEALFLIGKSYYYKGNFFLALEKFEELIELAETDNLRRQGTIWKARTLLDLEQYDGGITFVTSVLPEEFWTPASRSEVQVLLAEHHAMQEEWEEAALHLGEAISSFREGVLKGRVFFLYGQVLERLGRFGEAFFAYDNVASRFPEYDYIYWSKMKKAEVARKEGNLETALSIYRGMSRDDKNFERLDRINYEIARTQEMGGEIAEAERGYNDVLRSQRIDASPNVEAKSYFRLGKIFSEVYKNLSVAAAYFDSSSARVGDTEYLESNFNADELASAFGSYTDLRNTINKLDSLLWLGSLEPDQRDSVLTEIRRQRRAGLNDQAENRANRSDRLLNVASSEAPVDTEENTAYEYGFLNHKNIQLKQEAINGFAAVWGNRPLVDGWRRFEAVRGIRTSSVEAAGENEEMNARSGAPIPESDDDDLAIDLSEIPTSEEQRTSYLRDLVSAKYELGNLFFISLNMPDSAQTYFTDIVRNHPESSLVPQSMYSLFEIFSENGDKDEADYWGNQILRLYPGTRFAKNVASRSSEVQPTAVEDSSGLLRRRFQQISASADTASPSTDTAEQLRKLAIAHSSSEIAPFIHYRAIETYVALARINTDSALYTKFMAARDTDSLSLSPDSTQWDNYPFYGTYWDSVRTVITEYDSMFIEKPHADKLNALKAALDTSKAPADLASRAVPAPARQPAAKPTAPSDTASKAQQEEGKMGKEAVKACYEYGQSLDIVGGISNFLSRLDYPPDLQGRELSGMISYKLQISEIGRVTEYQLASDIAYPGLEQTFADAIEKYLIFDPVIVNGKPQSVTCRMLFPVDV